MRINRFLAAAGLGSRRSCEELIRTGQVTINGVLCENLATTVEPSAVVKVGHQVVRVAAPMTIVINKPPGFTCTAADTHARQTIFDLLPGNFPRLFHVGRLDRESEGLLILTNDGDLSLKLTHPRYKVEKEYEVVLDHAFDSAQIPKLLHGMSLEEGWAKMEAVYKLAPNKVKVVLRQGLKRQIRKMFYEVGYEVIKLVRTRIGQLTIGSMPPGGWRAVTQKEIETLLAEGLKHAAEHPQPRHPRGKPRHYSAAHGQAGEKRSYPRHSGEERKAEVPTGRRPMRSPGPRRGEYGGHGAHPKVEEIPFIPRARREASGAGAKPVSFHGGKASPHQPWLKKKKKERTAVVARPAKPHPFAKFERRKREF